MKHNKTGGLLAATMLLASSLPAMAVELDSDAKKLGYTIGLDIGNSLREQGKPVDIDALVEALNTAYNGETPAMTPEEVATFRTEFMAKRQAELEAERAAEASANASRNAEFIAENRRRDGVTETTSGLQYEVLEMGDGMRPAASDTVTVHYSGKLLDGTEFDSSYQRNEPATFPLQNVIPGWTEGLQLMPVGSKFKFFIPPDIAYGADGRPPVIPPAALLVFEVELLEIAGNN